MSDFVETECACGRKWLESRYVDKCAVCNKPSEPPVDRVLRDAISLHLFQKYDSQYDTSHMESTAFDTDASDIVAIIKRHLSKRESAQPDEIPHELKIVKRALEAALPSIRKAREANPPKDVRLATDDDYARSLVEMALKVLPRLNVLERESGWQPIETAPKDGTAILVKTERGYYLEAFWGDGLMNKAEQHCNGWFANKEDMHPDCWTDGVCWESNADEERSDHPVAWMPL